MHKKTNCLEQWFTQRWYAPHAGVLNLLRPLACLYKNFMQRRRQAYATGKKSAYHPGVPVIIIGNLHVGGGGKSPLVSTLAQHFKSLGYNPGIVSRGYAAQAPVYPQLVTPSSSPDLVGDEPVMLAQQTGVPVAVDPNRPNAAKLLVQEHGCNLILADDGLQHLRLARDIEIIVMDASRGLGNGFCLPVGPLREPLSRLSSADWLVLQGDAAAVAAIKPKLPPLKNQLISYELSIGAWHSGAGTQQAACPFNAGQNINALAGISNPEKFFQQLESLGLQVNRRPLPDHAPLNSADLQFDNPYPVVLTAKDAVKLQPWLHANHWVMQVNCPLPKDFLNKLEKELVTLS